jgi:hypothetical protein
VAKKQTAPPPQEPPPNPKRSPLWPKPVPVIGLTGDYASGKTLFGLTIDPGPRTLVYDNEKSSASYSDLGHERIDVPQSMMEAYDGNPYTPLDTFVWWRNHVRTLTPGLYSVIVLDPATEIEDGLADFVQANPEAFGKTRQQYLKSSALMWGDVKSYWKRILTDLASRCETFVFTVHLKAVWADNKPTAKKTPKGKSTLEELASLFLWMDRKADREGNRPAKPSAVVRKDRLVHTRVVNGEVVITPAMPPRLPEATPAAIRRYMLNPPDYNKLNAAELAPEAVLSDDDRLELRVRVAEAEAEAERLKLERERPTRHVAKATAASASVTSRPAPKPAEAVETVDPADAAEPEGQTLQEAIAEMCPEMGEGGGPVTDEQLERLADLRDELFADADEDEVKAAWKKIIAKRGVKTARELTREQADELIGNLKAKLAEDEAA